MFFRYLKKKKYWIILFTVLTIVATASKAVFQLRISPIFDDAQVGNYSSVIKRMGFMFAWYLSFRLLNYYANLVGIHIVNTVRRDIKKDLFHAALNKRLPDHADRNTGEYIAEYTNDITIIETKFLTPFLEILTFIITIVSTGAAILTIDFKMAAVIIFGALLCTILPVLTTKYTSGRMFRFLTSFDSLVQHLKDLFGAFFTFKNYAVEDKVTSRFSDENKRAEEMKFKAELSIEIVNSLIGRLSWAIEIFVVVIGLIGVIQGSISSSDVFAAFLLAGNLGMPLQSLGHRISMMRSVKSIEKKFAKVCTLDEKIKPEKALSESITPFDISLYNISLRLKDNLVLDDISIRFEKGKKYLIIGNNGSGKSSLAKLLKGYYLHYDGSAMLGEFDLRSPAGTEFIRHISYSNENVSLLTDTIRNNILLYRDCPEDRLNQAVEMAAFTLPLEKEVGENGRFLSSGERRKLEIARSLIENPSVLIFDEVVSTLDVETSFEIESLILTLEDRTVIMISNAISGKLLGKYDQIILMQDGRILAQGSHDELLKTCDEYRKLYRIRCVNE